MATLALVRTGVFGLFKLKFRKAYVYDLQDVAKAVEASSSKGINRVQHVRDPVSGDVQVVVCDWKTYFSARLKSIPKITGFRHFRFSQDEPGSVFVRELPDSEEKKMCLFKRGVNVDFDMHFLPETIEKPGLSPERQWYLYEQVREHVPEPAKDTVAPKPSVAKPKKSKTKKCDE